jgi:peptidyl-prolyl cis-trans isomerase B (cyclophilin B)
MLNRNRTVGSKTALCTDPQSLGRIVIGLYGKHLPITTANFKRAVEQGLFTGTIFHKVLPGAFVQAGRQGSKRQGEVFVPKDSQAPNPELLSGASYRLQHMRPGTVSLMLSQNDDYPDIKQAREYRNMQFLITTGPGPVPTLDGENVVFGRVVEGLGTVGSISAVPTFSPNEKARQMNAVASFLGDERAAKARAKWGRPLKAVVITGGGVL